MGFCDALAHQRYSSSLDRSSPNVKDFVLAHIVTVAAFQFAENDCG
jgi:hypothetical protein